MADYHRINGVLFKRKFAWLPTLCETNEKDFGSPGYVCRWVFLGRYWKSADDQYFDVTEARMDYLFEQEMLQRQQTVTASNQSPPYASSASAIAVRPAAGTVSLAPELETAIRKIVEENIYELHKRFMDEIFENLPANVVPQEQIDRIYEKMGYEKK